MTISDFRIPIQKILPDSGYARGTQLSTGYKPGIKTAMPYKTAIIITQSHPPFVSPAAFRASRAQHSETILEALRSPVVRRQLIINLNTLMIAQIQVPKTNVAVTSQL